MMDKVQAATPVASPPSGTSPPNARDEALRAAAQDLEASFLAEMLKSTGMGKPQSQFGGGVGEEQFTSFLVQAQAQEIAKSGGLGLAEHIFEALKERADAR